MSNFGKINTQLLGITASEIKEVDASDSEVISRQLMSRVRDVVATIRPDGIIFNTMCIRAMEEVVYIQMLIDREKQMLYVKATDEYDKDSHRWCTVKEDKRESRKITGREFGNRIYKLMGWSKAYYYRVGGSPALQVGTEDEYLMAFDLSEFDGILMTSKALASAGVDDEDLGEQANELREEIARMEAERAAAKEANAEGKKLRVKKKVEHQESLQNDAFGVKQKDHVDRIVVPPLEQLEMLSMMSEGRNTDVE